MTPEARKEYRAACRTQLLLWSQGTSTHNSFNGECCPDFSCCHPEMLEKDADKRREEYLKFCLEDGVIN